MNPKSIGSAEDPGQVPEAISEETTSEPEQLSGEEVKDETEEVEESKSRAAPDESRLLYQEFLMDPEVTVKEWLDER